MQDKQEMSWGKIDHTGAEIWDTNPVFLGDKFLWKDKLKLFFYPKKYLLYNYVRRSKPKRVLDVGCGTGAAVIDMKKMFGRGVEVRGIDVVKIQVEIAREKSKQHGVWAEFDWYEGVWTEFDSEYFDAIHTSDVLGHVENVRAWLKDLHRILKPGGTLAMFAESKLGKHAHIRKYLFNRGLNIDPHAEFHISLYSKKEIKKLLEEAGFEVKKMYSIFWAAFLFHPDEFYEKLQNQNKFFFLKLINKILYWIKKKTHPVSTALAELYGLAEMVTIGRFVESQGYIILAKKK